MMSEDTEKSVDKVEGVFAGLLLLVGLLVVALEIVSRAVFGVSYIWSEEISRYTLIWMTYFGVAAGVAANSHIRVTVLVDLLPESWRCRVEIGVAMLCTVFAAFVVWFGVNWVSDSRSFGLMSADSYIPVPIWVFQLIIPIGMTLVLLRFIQRILRLLRGQEVVKPDSPF